MNYKLNKADQAKEREKGVLGTAWRRLVPLMIEEKLTVTIALVAIALSSAASLIAPALIARAIDGPITHGDWGGVMRYAGLLLAVYLAGTAASYVQIRFMGGMGRRVLFRLRNAIFTKLQELPVEFFYLNKAGDLISRINNDTDKLNQFFAQALMQFVGNSALIAGTGVCLLYINPRLGAAALVPAAIVLILTQLLSPWVKRVSLRSLQKLGALSGEIQESLNNFKVIVIFNRLDYFREKFTEANEANYQASVRAGVASNTFMPIYTLASTVAQFTVLIYGLYLTSIGEFSVGFLVGFLLYVNNFYNPLRQLASVWSSLQFALAGLDRISEVLALQSNMQVISSEKRGNVDAVVQFDQVNFRYDESGDILNDVSFALERGKTYALVGPTGGGKTTTASLMARLYDPTEGTVYLDGRDIRSVEPAVLARKIGFILQEPILFTGTVKENILYGNTEYVNATNEEALELLERANLTKLLTRFNEGLDTKVATSGEAISLGQKQLIAFMRAVLRNPEILIFDEATANIDTVTEQLLEEILHKLPKTTTRVIIAHRLNTISEADEIFFVNGGHITVAGDMQHAVDMLLHETRQS